MPSVFQPLRLRLIAACGALVRVSLLSLAGLKQRTAHRAPLQNLPSQTQALGHAQASGFDTTYFGFADKRYIFSKPQDMPAGYDPTARPWYTSAAAGPGVVVTEPCVDASTQKLVLTFALALREGGAVRAVAADSPSCATRCAMSPPARAT